MLLRMSTLFLRTLREDPAGAELPSHRLLLRAGYVRRAAPGGYTWLPLGRRVLDRVTAVVREEMTAIGGQEVTFPGLLPAEPYQRSGRWTEYGPDMFRVRDRRGGDFVLAPTHEEAFTALVRDLYTSYRDYPVILYQVQTKFRDEIRPRAGLLRAREFLMKDSYSFDLDQAGLSAAYAAHRAAYRRVFDRLRVEHAVVEAFGGAMGGSRSEEFLAVSPSGEDSYAACDTCGYAANVEVVATPAPAVTDPLAHPAARTLGTPDTPTIESLVGLLNARRVDDRADWTAAHTLKNVVLAVTRPGAQAAELLVVGVPGDREVDAKRLAAALYPATVALHEDFAATPDLVRGYIGPQALAKLGVRYLVDPRVATGTAWVTGANEPGRHAVDVVCGRDFVPDGVIEAAGIRDGDACPRCGTGQLTLRRGIEVGHIFQLGTRFADVVGLTALGSSGRAEPVTMGSYGIGLSRLVAVIAEQHHDERGLCWPASSTPVDVHVVATGAAQRDAALDLAGRLAGAGRSVLVDDRDGVSAGVKFTDAELIGAPRIVVVGRRLSDGYVELRARPTGERADVPLDGLVERL